MIRREIPLTIAYSVIRYCRYFLFVIFTGFSIAMLSQDHSSSITPCQVASSSKNIYVEWGSSPTFFSKNKRNYSIPFKELEKEILFLGTTIDPDGQILLSVKQSGVRKLISPGEKVYLIYRDEKLEFSEVKTPLILSAILQNNNLLAINLSLDLDPSILYNVDNTYHFVKSKEERYILSNSDTLMNTPMFRSLQKAKWWGVDYLFISQPTGDNLYGSRKQRVQFTYDDYGEILHLDPGESLVWEKKGWSFATSPNDDIKSHYVIRIKEIHTDKLEVILWDTKGLPLHTFFIPLYTTCNELPSIEILSNIKKRTRTVASFLLGKTRVTMKKGDLAIETPHGWKITHSQEEKKNIFTHQVLGSIFAFDGMEMEGATIYFTGRILDPMRTCYQPVRIPLLQNKRKERKNQNIFPEVQLSLIGNE